VAAEARPKITRADIEAKVRELTGQVQEQADRARPAVLPAAVAGGVAVLLLAYLLGRRAGRRRSAVVEIRRI
jgi:hypothetical protein